MNQVTRMPSASIDSYTSQSHIWPPPLPLDESEEQRIFREEQEIKARAISDAIDRAIQLDKAERRRRRPATKILLLGQAESGKSTILKNFQLLFAPNSFHAEIEAWKAVIYLNLVKSVNFVLDLLEEKKPTRTTSSSGQTRSRPSTALSERSSTNDLRHIKLRLAPLREVEQMLSRRFCPVDTLAESNDKPKYHPDRASEVSVRSGWKNILTVRKTTISSSASSDTLQDAQRVIEACKDDIRKLWDDPIVQAGLTKYGVHLQDQSGFFLADVLRIASKNYTPTPNDILRARLQTMGVEEHHLIMETEAERGKSWLIYDVGGSRGQRAVWAPFIDDVDVIIFLAPISVFNQSLAEDRLVNRLFDSFDLWKQLCSNKLLASTQFIILLNKADILEAKLNSGIQFSQYVTSYRDPNDSQHVTKYLKNKFNSLHQRLTSNNSRARKLYTHVTCATDTQATSLVLTNIRDVILVNSLAKVDMV